jgi:hypothetical protein
MCKLRLKIGKRWITKVDVGSQSEQPDEGDRMKAAFSDSLKRAAVKFGIARYLYRLPLQWTDYDPAKKKFTAVPKLPAFAVPKAAPAAKPEPSPKAEPAKPSNPLPADGKEMHRRLRARDALLAGEGRCMIGSLIASVVEAGVRAGFGRDLDTWSGPAIELAVEQTKKFIAGLPAGKKAEDPILEACRPAGLTWEQFLGLRGEDLGLPPGFPIDELSDLERHQVLEKLAQLARNRPQREAAR